MLKDLIKNQAHGKVTLCKEADTVLKNAGIITTSFKFSEDKESQIQQANALAALSNDTDTSPRDTSPRE